MNHRTQLGFVAGSLLSTCRSEDTLREPRGGEESDVRWKRSRRTLRIILERRPAGSGLSTAIDEGDSRRGARAGCGYRGRRLSFPTGLVSQSFSIDRPSRDGQTGGRAGLLAWKSASLLWMSFVISPESMASGGTLTEIAAASLELTAASAAISECDSTDVVAQERGPARRPWSKSLRKLEGELRPGGSSAVLTLRLRVSTIRRRGGHWNLMKTYSKRCRSRADAMTRQRLNQGLAGSCGVSARPARFCEAAGCCHRSAAPRSVAAGRAGN